jgi:ACS family hexuronate transporter-like MFS transporter
MPFPEMKIMNKRMIFLMVGITIIAAADRQVMSLLKPVLDDEFGWSVRDYAGISTVTQIASAVSLLISGWLVDRLGPRWTLGAAMSGWSLMTICHAVARNVVQFSMIRGALGAFEGAGMPSVMKVVATTIPRHQRAMTVGYLNAAPNVSAIITPLIVTSLMLYIDWRGIVTGLGVIGFFLVFLWFRKGTPVLERKAPVKRQETRAPAGWKRLISVFSVCKVCSDATWWVTLFWLPDILYTHFHLTMQETGMATAPVYVGAAAGAILGGVLPRWLSRVFRTHEQARRVVMAFAALCILPVSLVFVTSSLLLGVALLALALAAHQVFSSNLFGIATEWAPEEHVGRLVGVGAFCGNLGGATILWLTGFIPMGLVFVGCGVAYLAAWSVLEAGASPRWLKKHFQLSSHNVVFEGL